MAYLACTAAVTASVLGAAPSAEHRTVHWVKPGGSIQQAVNSAHPGDTVLLSPGTYHESVRVTVSNLTLRGYGARSTVIVPGKASGSCAKAGNGICVTGTDKKRVKDVTVSSLTLRGFAKHGLWASGTDRLTVQGVVAEKNGQWGIAQERSVRGVFRYNLAQKNGDAGLFLSNTVSTEEGARDSLGTVVSHNVLAGNRIGVTVRRLRNLTVDHNEATGNCAAVFVVGDENKPHVGALSVVRNYIHANNKFCPKTPGCPSCRAPESSSPEPRRRWWRRTGSRTTWAPPRCPAASFSTRASWAPSTSTTRSATTWRSATARPTSPTATAPRASATPSTTTPARTPSPPDCADPSSPTSTIPEARHDNDHC